MKRTESFKPIAILGAVLALILVIAGCRAKTAEETQALVDAKALASVQLQELVAEFPENPLFASERAKLEAPPAASRSQKSGSY
jgi:hypothetical protein